MSEVYESDEDTNMNESEDEEAIELDDDELDEPDTDNESLLEPQVILRNEATCQLCQGPLSSHYLGQPCGSYESSSSGAGHFLFEESQSSIGSSASFSTATTTGNKPRCFICSARNPSREHLANHFMQEIIEELEGETQCTKCNFNAPECKALVLHDVSRHDGSYLDKILQDAALVSSKRAEVEAGRHRLSLGPLCPICDQQMHRSHGRDHISWHFLDELKELISEPTKCPECSYVGDKQEHVTRHLALFHCKLDEFLQDEQLVASKRAKVMAKPKKVIIGPKCPICDIKDPARDHVSRHFMNELMESVKCLDDQSQCPECSYRADKYQNVARHIALVHSKLDVLLADEELVSKRRSEYQSKPNKVNIGSECPVCDKQLTKQHSRVHIIWHFMEELREIVQTFPDPTKCDFCTYMNVSSDKVVKHIALGHSKLDEMLQDEELVQRKRALQCNKPNREKIGPLCPICDAKDPQREHVARHFSDELNELVSTLPDQYSCTECSYKGEKSAPRLGLHIALVHGKLDVFIKDKALVKQKRQQFLSQPKKLSIGPRCPICDKAFTMYQNREHVAWHFLPELREFISTFEDPTKCWKCDYTAEKMDNLVKHVALGHCKLDELLQDEDLVNEKRSKAMIKPRKVAIGPFCPICDSKDPAREHVARHFSDELMSIVNEYPDPCGCVECEYRGDKPKTLAIHVGLVHNKLDMMLLEPELVEKKREYFKGKIKKKVIGPVCPVCDVKFTKTQNRDHVSWHYIDELREIVQNFDDPGQCPKCPYTADTNEKMVKHVALGHSMLDALLQDANLLEVKRQKALNKPKKVAVGSTCPICDSKEPSREHVSRHFSDELNDIVLGFEDPTKCSQCSYSSDKSKNVAIHIALVHSILDHFLTDQDLIQNKRSQYSNKPQKINVGHSCPICDAEFVKGQNRDHVCWHFMEELREIVLNFPDTTMCNECPYSSDKLDNLVKHVALGHSKLDELLSNDELVAAKREQALNKPKKIHIGPTCPVCDLKFTKNQNRDHVSWHFMDELREFVQGTGSSRACQQCDYKTDRMDGLVKHYALGHCKLDEILSDEDLVKRKREEYAKKPKKMSFGHVCPICQESNRDRDHVSRHFMPELLEIVNEMPNRKVCNQCSYKNNKREYMAKHIALYHCKLDEFMADENLVEMKQKKVSLKPKRVPMGEHCVICGVSFPQREHVCRHFQDELLEITKTFASQLSCAHCSFTADRIEYVARHVGLVHRKLDEMLLDEELVKKKASEFNNSTNVTSGPTVKIEPVRKSQRQASKPVKKEDSVTLKPKIKKEEPSPGKKMEDSPTPSAPEVKIKEEVDISDYEIEDDSNLEPPKKMLKMDDQSEDSSMPAIDYDSASNQSLPEAPKAKKAKLQHAPSVTIEKAGVRKQEAKTPSVSLLKASLTKKTTPKTPSVSLLKQPLHKKTNLLMKSLLKKSPSVEITRKEKPIPPLPPSITLTPTMPKMNFLQPLIPELPTKPILDPASIADINNSWAESLMSNSSHGKQKQKSLNDWNLSPPQEELKTIGTCTLTPATGKPKGPNLPITPTITLQKVSSGKPTGITTLIAPSVTLTPASPKAKLKRLKVNITPTATITPLMKKNNTTGTMSLKPMFPSKPLEKAELGGLAFAKLGKPLINPEQVIITPELPAHVGEDDDDADDEEEIDDDEEGENMVLEPQILFDEDDEEEEQEEEEEVNDEEQESTFDDDEACEFCDLCGMELEHHPDNQPCPPEEGFQREFSHCPVCKRRDPTKEHVARHFLEELKEIVEGFENPLACNKCDYQSEKNAETAALHIALNHDMLKTVLPKNSEVKKVSIGNSCPICDFKDPSREHVSRHFMNELLDHVATLSDHLKCEQCSYQGEKPQNLAKHIALVHNLLDEYLSDQDLVQKKHSEAMMRPKKISIGSTCPVCLQAIQKRDSRVHVIWHFMEELREMVQEFPDATVCNFCPYTNPNPDKMAKHMALGHSKLDELLSNQELVAIKQQKALSKPKKLNIGPECPICCMQFTKSQNRDHVSWHFMDELREYVQTFEDTQQCNQCEYRSDKVDNLVKHLALGHSKLDELLMNEELVAAKKELAKAKPKKVSIGPTCPICDLAFTKSQNRDHVSWHFMEELRAIVNDFENPHSCNQCDYQTDKVDNLVKHLALGHSKLDEFLMDDDLVAAKRNQYHATRK